jgi:hypothetical protein
MSRFHMSFHVEEMTLFNSTLHLFPTNNLFYLHNRQMLKSLNFPIERCVAKYTQQK